MSGLVMTTRSRVRRNKKISMDSGEMGYDKEVNVMLRKKVGNI